jgi:AraC-like DNA-binding protein
MAAPPRKQVHLIGPGCQERFLALDSPPAQPLRDAGVVLSGVSDLVKPYEICRPETPFHVVLHCLAGSARLEVAGCPPRLAAGELAILPAGMAHAYGVDSGTWRILWFHFALSAGLGQALRGRAAVVRNAAHLPRLHAAMEGFLAESRGGDDRSRRAAELQGELVACYLERELAADVDPRAAAQRRRLQQLWDDVDRNLRHPWSVAALASQVHESQINLYRLCARHFGVKPMAMVTRLRMERARQLLRETDEPLKRIADWVGYRNEFAFSTAFKRFGGASPRDFRRKAREPSG